jgi:tetratricopeptide (TPR) repeat protein
MLPDRSTNTARRPVMVPRLSAAALLVMVCLAYVPLSQAGFIWDDDSYVTENPALRSGSGLRDIWFRPGAVPQYYPLTFTSFWLEYQIWRDWALGYHAVNVLLHALSTVLFWQVLRRLAVPGAWLAAALFALHPVQVESVAWVTERKNVLSGVFYWLALLAWMRSGGLPEDNVTLNQSTHWGWYILALASYMAALLSKTVTCSLPAVILLVVWWQQGKLTRRDWLRMVPFLILGLLAAAMTVRMETEHVGARGPEWEFSSFDRILISARALFFYAGKLLLPTDLTFTYPRWQVDPKEWWQWVYPLAAVAILAALWLTQQRFGRGPTVAALCFAGTLMPALGFFNVYPMRYSFVADHFQYLACAALFALAAAILTRITPSPTDTRRYVVPIVLLAILAVLTYRQAGVYRSKWTLWKDTLAKNPDCGLAHNELGLLCVHDALMAQADQQEQLWDAAQRHFERVLPFDPVTAHNNMGTACSLQGDWDGARKHYQQTLGLKADDFNARYNLGLLEAKAGQTDKAIGYFQSALEIQPDHEGAHTDLGLALLKRGRVAEARDHLERAVALDPRSWRAHNGLGQALDRIGQTKEAAFHFSQVIALEPRYVPAQECLGHVLQRSR